MKSTLIDIGKAWIGPIIAALTLAQAQLLVTMLAAGLSAAYTLWKWNRERK